VNTSPLRKSCPRKPGDGVPPVGGLVPEGVEVTGLVVPAAGVLHDDGEAGIEGARDLEPDDACDMNDDDLSYGIRCRNTGMPWTWTILAAECHASSGITV
jgi:hypothetical protein